MFANIEDANIALDKLTIVVDKREIRWRATHSCSKRRGVGNSRSIVWCDWIMRNAFLLLSLFESFWLFEFRTFRSTFYATKKKTVDLKTSTVGCRDIRDAFVVEDPDDNTDTDDEAQHPVPKLVRLDGPKVANVYSMKQVYGHHFRLLSSFRIVFSSQHLLMQRVKRCSIFFSKFLHRFILLRYQISCYIWYLMSDTNLILLWMFLIMQALEQLILNAKITRSRRVENKNDTMAWQTVRNIAVAR